ncbi:MAG: histidine kinase [Saprospiraceae bacterium]|nr:histidine kinase [Saprospiraceae bacterium]
MLSLLIFSILIGIAFYLYEIKESKLRVEFDKKLMLHENNKLKLDILRTQMNPHFNFNALQTVIRVLQKGELSTGTEYLFKISKLQRRILESTKREFIEINEEIEILNLYLDIEMARFSKKLTIDFHVDEDLDEDTQEIPPMIVQPLIENAIWHGLSDDRVTNKN